MKYCVHLFAVIKDDLGRITHASNCAHCGIGYSEYVNSILTNPNIKFTDFINQDKQLKTN